MCGIRLNLSLKSIGPILLLLLVVVSLYSSPLDELIEISNSLEKHTNFLESNINSLSTRTTDLEKNYQRQMNIQNNLLSSLDKLQFISQEQGTTLRTFGGIQTVLGQQMTGLESGYKSMERKLRLQSKVIKVGSGILVGYILGNEIGKLFNLEYGGLIGAGLGFTVTIFL